MLNLENEFIIERQYITFHKGIMDDACRANRFDIVEYMYIKTKNSNFKIDLRKNNSFKDIYNELLSKKKR